MPSSMTGFAEATLSHAGFCMVWRLRSVNHRYLDLSFRRPGNWPGNWHDLEGEASKRLQACFVRGHLDCELHLTTEAGRGRVLELDHTLLQDLLRLEAELVAQVGAGRGGFAVDRLLAWPGLIREHQPDEQDGPELLQAALSLLEEAVRELETARRVEGQALTALVQALLNNLGGLLTEVEALLPMVRMEQKRLLRVRVAELIDTAVDQDALAREVAVLLNRMDVAEELERLRMHCAELHNLLLGSEPVGRRLDFFCQELNREANTLCSKSQSAALTHLGVEIKLVVEKIREQAQNLE